MNINKAELETTKQATKVALDKALAKFSPDGDKDILSLVEVANLFEHLLEVGYGMEGKDPAATQNLILQNLRNLKDALDKFTPEYIEGSLIQAKTSHPINKDELVGVLSNSLPKDMDDATRAAKVKEILEEYNKAEESGELYKQYAYVAEYNGVRSFATDVLLLACLL